MDRRRRAADSGETLIELIITILVLGTGVIAIAAGIAVSVQTSDTHRKQSTAGAYARSYAEAIESFISGGGYKPCAAASDFPAYAPPTGYTASIVGVEYWINGGTQAAPNFAWKSLSGCSLTNDSGVQRLTLQIASSDNGGTSQRAAERVIVIIRKPCGSGSTCS